MLGGCSDIVILLFVSSVGLVLLFTSVFVFEFGVVHLLDEVMWRCIQI